MTEKQLNVTHEYEEIICFCSGTTKTAINALIDKGINTLDKIAYETGANTGCGSCDILIKELLATQAKQLNNN
jgi:bacterioferritin-associated ferredoxin